jgi:hypothetical protein
LGNCGLGITGLRIADSNSLIPEFQNPRIPQSQNPPIPESPLPWRTSHETMKFKHKII